MKTILFAIAMEGLDSKSADLFEQKTIAALKTGSREFIDAMPVHCDYKEGLEKMCAQYLPDCLIINEKLTGSGDVFELIKNIKSDYPDILITVLLSEPKQVGNLMLAQLTSAGIYNWVIQPWTPNSVADSLISPKKLKDVEMYMPKIVEGSNGLAFETKLVEKSVEKLEDLPDLLIDKSNNAIKVNGVSDLKTDEENNNSVPYRRIVNTGFGFGKSFKPKFKEAEPVEEPVKETAPIEPVENLEENESFDLGPTTDEEYVEEAPVQKENTVLEEGEKENKEEELTESASLSEDKQPESENKRRTSILDAIRALREKQKNEEDEDIKSNVLEEESPKTDSKPNIKDYSLDDEKYDKLDKNLVDEIKKEKPLKDKKEIKETKEEKEELKVTLSSIEFEPKYKKILFMRAMPVSSAVPVHVCKLMNASFVDFNKVSNNDGYFDILRTTIKEGQMPDAELIVGDVVAGNGVEKLVKKFDHVVAIVPEDYYSLKAFTEKYEGLYDGILIDKCTTSSITRKQLLSLAKDAKYIDTIKVDNCNRDVVQSAINHELLMDNVYFAEGMHYFLKDIGGVKWI